MKISFSFFLVLFIFVKVNYAFDYRAITFYFYIVFMKITKWSYSVDYTLGGRVSFGCASDISKQGNHRFLQSPGSSH